MLFLPCEVMRIDGDAVESLSWQREDNVCVVNQRYRRVPGRPLFHAEHHLIAGVMKVL